MITFDAIVIGTGGIGSAAVFQLAKRGVRVLGLDRFAGAHDQGSSHGHTRMIRQAYCEHPDYVPLVQRAYELWAELQQATQRQLYHEVGLLEVGPPEGLVVPGVMQSARQHNLDIDQLDSKDVLQRFPGFHVSENMAAVFEQRAGYLLVEQCVTAHQIEAIHYGAEFRTGEVRAWNADHDGVVIHTDRESMAAGRLIITAGAWARDLLREINISLAVVRKPQNWFANHDVRYSAQNGCPGFLYEVPEGLFYGFPQLDTRGVKIGEHSGGEVIDDLSNIDRNVDQQQRSRAQKFLSEFLPGVSSQATDHCMCMYTNSADGHFIVDHHPNHRQVTFSTGLSGHGFKFAPVLGEALAELAIDGATRLPIGFLTCDRFQ